VSEPDNVHTSPYAFRMKRSLGQYPFLSSDEPHFAFTELWRHAVGSGPSPKRAAQLRARVARSLHGSVEFTEVSSVLASEPPLRRRMAMLLAVPPKPTTPRVVIKSVHASLALEWVARETDAAVIVLRRSPLAVIASWFRMGWVEPGWRLPPAAAAEVVAPGVEIPSDTSDVSPLAWICWNTFTLMAHQESAVNAHPEWQVVDHEQLCEDPVAEFRSLVESVGWDWHPHIETFLHQSNRPGTGHETNRVVSGAVGTWRRVLNERQAETATQIQRQFPVLHRWP